MSESLILFDQRFYKQHDGVAMGSPTLANVFLCYHEKNWFLQVLPSIIFFLKLLNDEICSGFLSKKRYRQKKKSQETFWAYKSYVGHFEKVKEHISNCVVKQYHYCENFCAKNDEAMKKHFSICAAREGITYAFDNGQITFQDKGDLPFTVYFDFETTTTGGSLFFDPKMFVVSYCQIYSFHPS